MLTTNILISEILIKSYFYQAIFSKRVKKVTHRDSNQSEHYMGI